MTTIPRRTNGFAPPYNPMQLTTWVLLPTLILQFLLTISPVLPIAASVPLTLLFLSLSFCSAYFGYKACSINPIDTRLTCNLTTDSVTNTILDGETKYCWVCEKRVGIKSMHCKFCNKCVDTFDHHCQWLNTCIGKANYPYFYKAVVSTALFVMVHVIISLVLVILYFLNVGSIQKQSDALYGINMSVMVYIVIIFGVVTLGSSLLVGQLWYFHFNLRKKQMTTYAYIIDDNAKRREQYRESMSRQRERNAIKNKAKREGDKWMYVRMTAWEQFSGLDMCGCCIPCDPLSEKDSKPMNDLDAMEIGNNGTLNQDNEQENDSELESPTNDESTKLPKQTRENDNSITDDSERQDHEDPVHQIANQANAEKNSSDQKHSCEMKGEKLR